MTSAYPLPDDELAARVRALAGALGEWPSQRRVMRECRVGAPRADAALAALREEGFEPAPPRALSVVHAQPESTQEHAGEHPDAGADATAEADPGRGQIVGESQVAGAAGAAPPATRRVPRCH